MPRCDPRCDATPSALARARKGAENKYPRTVDMPYADTDARNAYDRRRYAGGAGGTKQAKALLKRLRDAYDEGTRFQGGKASTLEKYRIRVYWDENETGMQTQRASLD